MFLPCQRLFHFCAWTGAEDFELELGPWSVLGQRALVAPHFEPDFDAVALPPCRLLRIPASAYAAALTAVRPALQLSLPAVRIDAVTLWVRRACCDLTPPPPPLLPCCLPFCSKPKHSYVIETSALRLCRR